MTTYIAILFGVLIFCLILISLNEYGLNYDKINKRLSNIGTAVKSDFDLDEDLNKSLSDRLLKPMAGSAVNFVKKLIPEYGENDKEKTKKFRKMLRQAGITMSVSEYQAIRLVSIIGTTILFFVISFIMKMDKLMILAMPLLGAYSAFTVMRFSLMSRITKRKEQMERQLPDILDMLSVSVEAGLGFEQALLHVINQFKGPLVDELTITYREMTMGRSRKDALTLLGERCDIDDLKSFTGAVIQAGRMGISLKNILRTQSAAIRLSRKSKIQEQAAKLSVKILIPMILFIFPVLFIVLMGPAVVRIMEMFGGM